MDKYRIYIGAFLVLVILAGGLTLIYRKKSLAQLENNSQSTTGSANEELIQRIDELEAKIKQLEESGGKISGQSSSSNDQGEKININTADVVTLDKLPGVGPTRAQAIIDYRKTYGLFKKPSDIQKIKGIGPATYEKMKDMITVE